MQLTRTAGTLLAFGFFFLSACSTTEINLDTAESEMDAGNFDHALRSVNSIIDDAPDNSEALWLKLVILDRAAESRENPDHRSPYYQEMNHVSSQLNQNDPEYRQTDRETVLEQAWYREYQQADDILNASGIELSGDVLHRAASHLENAIIIDGKRTESYSLKAVAHYRAGEMQKATETLLQAGELFDSVPAEIIEKLAYLLLEEGQLQKAIELYSSLIELYPEHTDARHGLINAYILDEQHQQSIYLLRELAEQVPDDIMYREALATELFFFIQERISRLLEEGSNEPDVRLFFDDFVQDLDEAEEHFLYILDRHPDPDEITFITAVFYKNTAGNLMRLAEYNQTGLSDQLNLKAKDLLETSIPVWKRVADRNPENPEIWRNLYQVYILLEMEEEAEEAYSRTNL